MSSSRAEERRRRQYPLDWPPGGPAVGLPLDPLPDELPSPRLAIDTETTGLDDHGEDMPVALVVADAEREWYLPWGHREGRQHEARAVRDWARDKLAGKELVFKEAKFDLRMAKKWGLDLEAMGCTVRDVRHAAALLDDHRREFTLEALALDRLGAGKLPRPAELWRQPAHVAAPYGRRDGRLTYDLASSYDPDVEAEGLRGVLDMEDSLIYAVKDMEDQGAWLDVPKLERWTREVERARVERIMYIHNRTGLRVNPDSPQTMDRLWQHLGLEYEGTFDEDALKRVAGHFEYPQGQKPRWVVDCPEVMAALEARQLASLLSKYLVKYRNAMRPDGLLRYKLHQLRADEGGTITGRFASSSVNIQQVMKPDKQEPVTSPWLIRELFVPAPGAFSWMCADASQIEFRLLAHYTKSPRLIKPYRDDPDTDFHQMVTEVVLNNCMPRVLAKNVNFMKVYGGGAGKLQAMAKMAGKNMTLQEARDADATYNRLFPEAKKLLNRCTRLAETRGWVKTYMGRRRRYRQGDRFYSALNAVLQGTAADLMKLAIRALYDARRTTGYLQRLTCHDETDGDCQREDSARLAAECLMDQRLPLRVPITWEAGEGPNWAAASKAEPVQTIRSSYQGGEPA